MLKILTKHIRDTENPQTYFQHFNIAFINSIHLIFSGIIGIIHAIFPWWFPFYTSTTIIKCTKILIDTKRHKHEFEKIMPGYLNDDND